MEEIIKGLVGKKIDVSFGSGAVFRGEVIEVLSGVALLRDEDEKTAYVAIEKIASIRECSDATVRPGFIA